MQRLSLALFVGLVALELALRLTGLQLPMHQTWWWQAELGWTQVPGAVFDYVVEGRPVHAAFNAAGFRDRERALAKPVGTRRIVVVGDSFCEAMQVDLDDTFHQQLAAQLTATGSGPVEAINLGVGDWGQGQEWLALRDRGFAYAPDLVVCEVFPLNDIANNGLDLYGLGKSHNDLYRPYFVEQAGGELVETRRDPWLHRLRLLSRTFLNVERAWQSVAWRLEGSGEEQKWATRARAAGFAGTAPLLQTFVDESQQAPAVQRSWRVTERLLQTMATACRERGVPFVVVVAAWNATIGPGWASVQAQQSMPLDADYPDRRLQALGERCGFEVVPTRALLAQVGDAFVSDGHWNAAGHRAVAAALAQRIVQRRLLTK